MFKKDDIVVLKNDTSYIKSNSSFKDLIFKVLHDNDEFCYFDKSGANCYVKDARLATSLEIFAYNQGITNINDIKDLTYEIY